jgi:hypothetical protein
MGKCAPVSNSGIDNFPELEARLSTSRGPLSFDLFTSAKIRAIASLDQQGGNCCASLSISKLLKLARIATMRGSTADRVERLIADHKVDVCTIGPERIVTG